MGFISKETDSEGVKHTVKAGKNNKPFFSGKVAGYLPEEILGSPPACFRPTSNVRLTRHETDILVLICGEFSTKQIIGLVGLSSRTVEKYRLRLLKKTGSLNVAGMVKFAVAKGIIQVC